MQQDNAAEEFSRLIQIMKDLREKCPWDRKQTIQTLRALTIEELYELADAITMKDWPGIREELGDLLLHIVFYARIGEEEQALTLADVIRGINEKLIARHPHIYGGLEQGLQINNEDDVKRNWEKLKLREGKTSVLGGVPTSLPATIKAMRLQEKARQVGFEWENPAQVWEKVEEETLELQEAIGIGDQAQVEAEFGDLMFSLINYARFLHIDAEDCLEKTNKKFISRFTEMERVASARGKNLTEMSLQEMDQIWNLVKKQKQPD